MATCPNCGNETLGGAVFCDQCGSQLPAPTAAAAAPAAAPAGGSAICPACGAGNVPGEAFCDYCGSPLEAPVPTAEEVPELEPVSSEAELEVGTEPPTEISAPAETGKEERLTCPACGAEVLPGEAFCADCGATLAEPPIPPEPVVEEEAAPAPEPAPEPPEAPVAVTEEAVPETVLEEPPPTPEAAPEPPGVPEAVVEEPAAEPVAVPEPVVEPAPPPPAPAPPTCPACGADVESADRFCSNCGYKLEAEPAPAPVEAAPVAPAPPPATVGPRLVVVASGAEIPLQAGDEILIGREDPVSGIYPDVDLTPHEGEEGGVSRQHARLIIEGANYYIEDLDSTNYTFVNKQKLTPKTRHALKDGDEIRCGRVALVLRTG